MSEQINLINAALSLRTRLSTTIDVHSSDPANSAGSNRRVIAHMYEEDNDNFYLSTNRSGTWEWVQINANADEIGANIKVLNTYSEFPSTGEDDVLYITRDTKSIYYWDSSSEINAYEPLSKQPEYQVKNTITERDAIPENERVEGMVVYVVEECVEYRLENDLVSWRIHYIEYNTNICDWSANWYIEPLTGNDLLGDGTIENPWKTLGRALQKIPSNMIGGTGNKFINVGEGQIEFDDKVKYLLPKFKINAGFRIVGKLELVTTDYSTVNGTQDPNNPFRRTLDSGQQFTSENQYYKYFAHGIASADYYMPIGKHGLTDIIATNFPEGYQLNSGIYEPKTTLNFPDGRFITMYGSQTFFLEKLKITSGSANFNFISTILDIKFLECIIEPQINRNLKLNGKFSFSRCLFVFDISGTGTGLLMNDQFTRGSNTCLFFNEAIDNSASLIRTTNSKLVFQMMYANNFAYIYDCRGLVEFLQTFGHYPIVYENIGSIFLIYGSGLQFNTGKWYGQNKMFIEDVDYMFSLAGGDKNINIDLRDGYIQNNKVPNKNWFTSPEDKTWGTVELSCIEGEPAKLVDPSKNFSIQYDGARNYWAPNEQIITISGNSSETITIGDITKHFGINILYSAINDIGTETLIEMGTIKVNNKNDNEISIVANFDNCDIGFSKQISGNNINLIITNNKTTEVKFDGKLEYYYI